MIRSMPAPLLRSRPRILLVEDDGAGCRSLQRLLRAHGYEVRGDMFLEGCSPAQVIGKPSREGAITDDVARLTNPR